jgi:transposase
VVPGIERQPRKKLEPSPERLLALLHRWRDEPIRAGGSITRIVLAFEAGRDGFWLARWLAARGVEAHVIPRTRAADPAVVPTFKGRLQQTQILRCPRVLESAKLG